MTKPLDGDEFAKQLGDIVTNVGDLTSDKFKEVVMSSVKQGSKNWKEQARAQGWKRGHHKYRKHGQSYVTGAYVKSIRSHMISKREDMPAGEIGSPKMPGMAHLLEFGHASPGGGRVRAYEHVDTAARRTFAYAEELAEEMVDGVLKEV